MLVHYKKNRKPAYYDSDSVSVGKILPDERPRGPFKSCGN